MRKTTDKPDTRNRGDVSDKSRKSEFLLRHLLDLFSDVLTESSVPADAIVSRFFRARKYLGSHDRAVLAESTYDMLRRESRLRFACDELLHQYPDSEAETILVASQIESNSTMANAEAAEYALDIPVAIFAQISSAVRELESQLPDMPEPQRSALEFGMPVWFVERVVQQYGDVANELLASLNEQAPIVLRSNTLVASRDALMAALLEQGIQCSPGPYSHDAIALDQRMNANAIPEFKQGAFELQDEGSQLISAIVDPHPNWRVFDACAGAGGKSLHLAAIMRGRGEVIAHDTNHARLKQTRPRVTRSTAQNIRVMDHERYIADRDSLIGQFDAVVIDAPCTGTGVLRRNPGSRRTLTQELLDRLVALQGEILEEYAPLVRERGLLLYATCSVLREESEDQVQKFLGAHSEFTPEPINCDETMKTLDGYFRCMPHRHNTDGFFAALLRRA